MVAHICKSHSSRLGKEDCEFKTSLRYCETLISQHQKHNKIIKLRGENEPKGRVEHRQQVSQGMFIEAWHLAFSAIFGTGLGWARVYNLFFF